MSSKQIETQDIIEFSEKAYLDYSMYVILDRALPFIGDGLKPVQRRIIYAMSELGLKATAKYKKSARTVGDVLGKYHPHGDSACYEAMVLMAQPFSYRYPFIDGQGNWGAIDDPKSFAAMRYTESKLSAYAELLLAEIGVGTVSWLPNFDGSLTEPESLPAQVPNVLLNGGSGIAVGMATDIPSHNLSEVVAACIHLLEKPTADLTALMAFIPAPDCPTNAHIVSSKAALRQLYETGTGSFKMRATYRIENGDIVIDSLPYQTSGAKVITQIAQQMRAKKLPLVEDLRDESDHQNAVRLVVVPRSNRVNVDELMLHLFASTDLEKSYRVNMNVIGLDGKPQVKNLVVMLKEWLVYRQQVVSARFEYQLAKIIDRLHILAGLLVAYINLDEVIRIIRHEDKPKQKLMTCFSLSEQQAEAVLELRLRQLVKLEELKIQTEQEALIKERASIETILSSDTRLKTVIKKELKAVVSEFGDVRRSKIIDDVIQAKVLTQDRILPSESVTVVVSKLGWVRSAKGWDIGGEGLSYKSGDGFLMSAQGKSNQQAIFLDSTGRSYSLPAHTLPSARGQGEPLTGRLSPQEGAEFVQILMGDEQQKVVLASSAGYGFITTIGDCLSKQKAGRGVMKLKNNALILPICKVNTIDEAYLATVSEQGRLLVFPLTQLPQLAKGKGNKLMDIAKAVFLKGEDGVKSIAVLTSDQTLKVYAGKRHLTVKFDDLVNYIGERARRGNLLPKGYQKVAKLAVISSS